MRFRGLESVPERKVLWVLEPSPLLLLVLILAAGPKLLAEAPPLPSGLGREGSSSGSEEQERAPPLPSGLGGEGSGSAAPGGGSPELPSGLGGGPEGSTPRPPVSPLTATTSPSIIARFLEGFSGFIEGRAGARIENTSYAGRETLAEVRLQLERQDRFKGGIRTLVTADFLLDEEQSSRSIDLNRGEGWIDLRQAHLLLRPFDGLDLKAGRQVLTWGTGNLLFLNDLFPKDWRSFLLGRDLEYLKAPSDAVRASYFTEWFNIDWVWTPEFDPDRFVDGSRVVFFDPGTGGFAGGKERVIDPRIPSGGEVALRLSRVLGPFEYSLYGYYGYWKSPVGQTSSGVPTFPRLQVYGASARGPLLGGVGNVEFAWYRSTDDRSGRDPLISNGQLRYLVGFERELATDLTLGLQYYLEQMLDYDAFRATQPPGLPTGDEFRHLVTVELTQLLLMQDLRLNGFLFYSPSDQDFHFRPNFSYKLDDAWTLAGGINLFVGSEPSTFFGQFEENSSAYLSIRYGF